MKIPNLTKLVLALGLALAFAYGCNREGLNESAIAPIEEASKLITYTDNVIDGQYIVAFEEAALPIEFRAAGMPYAESQKMIKEVSSKLLSKHGIANDKVAQTYSFALQGFAVSDVTDAELQKLLADPSVKYVEQDQEIRLQGGPPGGGGSSSCANNTSETVPCGIGVVGGGANYTGSNKAYVLDTGIDLTHPDLNVANFGFNAFSSGPDGNSLNDGNGHGTHVAGTIAAIGGNGIGVVGVAAGALVVPVKVLDRRGSGSISGVIAGVDYVGANGSAGDVANMSLGGGASTSLDDAVVAASGGGIWFVVAAGNSSADANNSSPARANGPYIRTIAAMNCSSVWASFSNFGVPPIDYIAPGVSVCSTLNGGGYTSYSGTSMAAPHAAGVILATNGNPSTCGSVTYNGVSYPKICM
jgi:subtilisin family serine protease